MRRRVHVLTSLDAAVATLVMPQPLFEHVKAALRRGAAEWPVERVAVLTSTCFDQLGVRCFLSAVQGAELLAETSRLNLQVHEICHRILDRWNIARVLGPVGPACEYSMSWEEPHARHRLERFAAAAEPLKIRASILAGIYLDGECALDAARTGIGSTAVAASKCMRRDQLLARWRRVAPLVGSFARALRMLFEEVHYRPGGPGAMRAQAHFEEMQACAAPLTPSRVDANVPRAAVQGAKRGSPSGLTPLIDRLSARRPGSPISPSIAKTRRSVRGHSTRC